MSAKESISYIEPEEDLITPIMAGEPPLFCWQLASNLLTGHRRLSIHTEMIPEQVENFYLGCVM